MGDKPTTQIKLGEYLHFKGKRHTVIGVARHSETLEEMVVYKHDGKLWVRPLQMFFEKVEVNGRFVPRFKFVGEK